MQPPVPSRQGAADCLCGTGMPHIGRVANPSFTHHYCSVNRRDAKRHARAFKGAKRALVVVAAAEPEAEPAPPAPQQAPRRRQQRTVTVQMDELKAGAEFEGTVVSIYAMAC